MHASGLAPGNSGNMRRHSTGGIMSSKWGPALEARLQNVRDHDTLEVHIFLAGEPARETFAHVRANAAGMLDDAETAPTVETRDTVIEGIKSRAREAQAGLLAALRGASGQAEFIDSHLGGDTTVSAVLPRADRVIARWITNSVTARLSPALLREVAARDDVIHLELARHADIEELLDQQRAPERWHNTVRIGPAPALPEFTDDDTPPPPTWGVRQVNAPLLWQQGLRGEGVLVAVIDTGVNYKHPDLASQMWNGGAKYPLHGYNFAENNDDPMDKKGHGTACAGIVAGNGASGNATGVAPEATIMAIRVGGSEGAFWDGMQFAIDQKVDVISMSMTWKYPSDPTYPGWRRMSEAVWAAGIVHANSTGNQGDDLAGFPIPFNVGTPGNCPPPWLSPLQLPAG
ncbi:MAG TPA: S8 family serine peptidase, partial [Longimicrobium sp.]